MDLDTSQLSQLTIALLGAIVILIAAHSTSLKTSVSILFVLIPFQLVETSFGSTNVAMTYVLAGLLLLSGRLKYAPMLPAIVAVIIAYLISISQLPQPMYVQHGKPLFLLVSSFLVFVLAYNYARTYPKPRDFVSILIFINVLCVMYCLAQLSVPPGESFRVFGLEMLSTNPNRGEGDARLVGPFGSPGITAAYYMTMNLILTYEASYSDGRRRIGLCLLGGVNLLMMMATASRGSFLVLLAAFPVVLLLARHRLGMGGVARVLGVAIVVLSIAGAAVVTFTDYDQMFIRLEATTVGQDGLPDSRARVWPIAWQHITERPLIGHGPRFVTDGDLRHISVHPAQLIAPFPHSLYLYLLMTVGIVGTAAVLFFLFSILRQVWQAARQGVFSGDYERGYVHLSSVVIGAFLVDEIRIEFLRDQFVDYAHFMFAFFGASLAWAHNSVINPIPHPSSAISEPSANRPPSDNTLAPQQASVSRQHSTRRPPEPNRQLG